MFLSAYIHLRKISTECCNFSGDSLHSLGSSSHTFAISKGAIFNKDALVRGCQYFDKQFPQKFTPLTHDRPC